MQWTQVTIKTTSAGIDEVCDCLSANGFDSFIVDDAEEFHEFLEENKQYWDYVDEELEKQMQGVSQIRLYVEQDANTPQTIAQIRQILAALRERNKTVEFGSLEVLLSSVQEEDWETSWKQYYQPLPIGRKLLVVPKWMEVENPENRIRVLLDPGMIFGTGAHASTQMCMQALEEVICGKEKVLDLGSGSGILSITALLLGAKSAVGVDIDPKAEDIARENAAINGLGADRFTACSGDVIADEKLLAALGGEYDVVLANIVADVIIPLCPIVPRFLKKGGRFICSGILNTRLDEVLAAIRRAGFSIEKTRQQEDWCQITAAPIG